MLNPIPELNPLLKQLRLSGMTESLASRNREAIEHQLSHPEFLALLVQDEVARREQKKYAMRVKRAGFRNNKTLESFDLDFNPHLNQAQLKELGSCG
ncbi:MAG: ATP-binding protein, partial [Methylococcales bacterium]|nr:ATP-binding protein [Methylococcales bacterium]